MRLYILLDTSGSMDGSKISALNDSMENIIIDLQEKAFNGKNIDIVVLSFARDVTWMHDKPINILDFNWKPLTASGMTSLGKACCELAKNISTYPANNENTAIVLLSDGCPTDDYDEGIMELRNLQTFNDADKFAIALGDNADLQTLIRFVDVQENIFIENKADRLIDALSTIMGNITNYTSTPLHSDDIDDEWS
jgi:uncharacterized protein YegL